MIQYSIRTVYLTIIAVLAGACTTTPQAPASDIQADTMAAPEYSDKAYFRLVRKYTNEAGEVDYGAWQNSQTDMAALDEQIALLAAVSPDSHPQKFESRAAEKGYWINAYNMLVLDAVLDHWPLESVRDVKISLTSRIVPGKGFFYDRKVVVGGWETNLYTLEKEVLKRQKDPRLHFAFNCASSSCPVLRPWEWTEEQLDQAARDFVNLPANVSVGDERVYLSRIFKWYRKDFPDDQLAYLTQYAEPDLARALREASENDLPIEYVEYDWDVNDATGSAEE